MASRTKVLQPSPPEPHHRFIVLFLAGILIGCHSTKTVENPPTPVQVNAVQFYAGTAGTRYSASIAPNAQVELLFKSAGYVSEILQVKGADGRQRSLQEGDWVTKGMVLATVRLDDYRNAVNQARAQLAQAAAVHQKATLDFGRASNLFAADSLTKSDYDAAKAQLESSTAAENAAKAVLAQAEIALNDCYLKAPVDAWVLKRSIEVGSLAGPGVTGFSLADTHLVKAVFGVPDVSIPVVQLGKPQIVTTDAVAGEFHGRITAISPAADPKSRVYSVEVTIPNPDNRLKVGMIASLTLAGPAMAKPVMVVPLGALVRSPDHPNGYAVFVVETLGDKSVARARNVEVGDIYGNLIGVSSGLKRDDRVVAGGATYLRDGQRVQLVP